MSSSFNIRPLGKWLQEVRNRESPRYLLQNILPADNLVVLSGAPKESKKTWLAMLASLCIATGKTVGQLQPIEARGVLYVYMEGDVPSTANRFEALAKGAGMGSLDEITNLRFMHRQHFIIDDDNHINELRREIRDHDVGLVVIDTLAKTMEADENSAKDVNKAIRCAEKLRGDACSVMLVHHVRKEGAKLSNYKHGLPEPDNDLRGSSALAGAYETHWAIRKYPDPLHDGMQSYLIVSGKEFPPRQYEYDFEIEGRVQQTKYGAIEVADSARLLLGQPTDLIEVTAPPSRAKKE